MPFVYKDLKKERLYSDAHYATQHLNKIRAVENETYMRQMGSSIDVTSNTLEPIVGPQTYIVSIVPDSEGADFGKAPFVGYFSSAPDSSENFGPILKFSEGTTFPETTPTDSKHYLLEIVGSQLGERLKNRINQLDAFAAGDPSIEPINPKSIRAILDFIVRFDVREIPELYSSSNGNIIAEWRKNKSNKLVVEFLGNERIKFLVFYRDLPLTGNVNRFSGINSSNSFISEIASPQVKDLLGITL